MTDTLQVPDRGSRTSAEQAHTPRRRRFRAWAHRALVARRAPVVKVHRWLSFVLVAWIVLECVTGSVIVFADEIDRAVNRDAYATTPGDVGLAAAIEAATQARPGDAVRFATTPSTATGGTYEVWMTDTDGTYHEVLVDPGTGALNDTDHHPQGLVALMERLHVELNSTSVLGIQPIVVLGWLAVGWLVVLLSGFYLWYWPGVKRWARALRVRTSRGAFTFSLDLHKTIGIVAFVPLLLVTVTGINFAFPTQVRWAWDRLTLGTMADDGATFPTSTPIAGATPIDADRARSVVASIDRSLEITSVSGPAGSTVGTWTVEAEADTSFLGAAGGSRTVEFSVDQYSGAVTAVDDPADDDWATRAYDEWSYQVHFGTFGGTTTRVLWVALGLTPVALAVTGTSMWWTRRTKRRARAAG